MVTMVYSNYALALEKAPDMLKQEERDLYLCRVRYKEFAEYVFRTHLPRGFSCIDCFRVTFKHKFKSKDNAERAAEVFSSRMGVRVDVNPSYVMDGTYRTISHYTLCLISAH